MVVELARAAGPPRFYEISVGDEVAASAPSGRLLVVRDVTERRLLEGRLGHAQRLETVGQLAGGVAHDFNNLLTVIGGNASLLAELPQPEVRGLAMEMLAAQERGLSLTRQLLAFARREVRRPEPLDLGEVVGGISRLLERLLGEQHRLRLEAGAPVPVVADRGQLEQVLVNLVSNARDALVGGGEVEVTVRRLDRREATALGSGLDAPRQALLQVADLGQGMAPEVLARIFEPFFTTKPRDKGTGLGLATVHGIVNQSGGQVTVESAPGRGTRFSIFLPSVEPALVSAGVRGPDARPA
jgi:two-component system cell cycle sensor histidine kinase/response regulator CckA